MLASWHQSGASEVTEMGPRLALQLHTAQLDRTPAPAMRPHAALTHCTNLKGLEDTGTYVYLAYSKRSTNAF